MRGNLSGSRNQGKRLRLYIEAAWRCQECGDRCAEQMHAEPGEKFLTIDHVIPLSKGGVGADWNLAVLCNVCNERKGDETWPHLFRHPVPPFAQMWVKYHERAIP